MLLTHNNVLRIGMATLIGALLIAAGCSGGATGQDATRTGLNAHNDGMRTVQLHFNGLDDLGADYVYEGWLIANGAPYSTGRFSVSGGRPFTQRFEVSQDIADAAVAFALTIEPAENDDPGPSMTHYLAGPFKGSSAKLSVSNALGVDLGDASGSFLLATPSTPAADDYNLGIWWVDPSAGPGPSLDLPTLPSGWAYEGWAVVDGVPMSTGRFTDPAMADSDGTGPTAGPNPGPPFPGQDFINPPVDLLGGTAVITVEPDPDNSSAPFTLKPLVGGIPMDLPGGTLSPMFNNAMASSPTGIATIVGP